MIKINDRFSIKREDRQWVLYDTTPSDHKDSKTGFKTRQSYYTRLHNVVNEMLERAPMGCNSLPEMIGSIEAIRSDVFRTLRGGA